MALHSTDTKEFAERLDSEAINTVVLASVDLQGRPFGKRMPSKEFLRIMHSGVNLSSCALGWDIAQSADMQVQFTGYHTGWHDMRILPDVATLRRLAWLDGTALVFGDLVNIGDSAEVAVAPRAILRRQQVLLAQSGLFPKVGTELEFFLFDGNYDHTRSKSYHGLSPVGAARSQDLINRATNSLEPYFQHLRNALEDSGIDVAFSRSEWGRGQWEVNILHHEPLEMADRQCLLKMACKDIAHAFGMSATFMAKPQTGDVGSSCHVHFSVEDASGRNLMREQSIDANQTLRRSLAGILAHIPEFMVWYAPTINSYRRTGRNQFAGNGRTWGVDNRTTTCRICGEGTDARRIEFRVPGADANPYLVLAALLASASDGLESQLEPGARCHGNAYDMDTDGVLPASLEEAIKHFELSKLTRACLTEGVVSHYAAHARFEVAQFKACVTDWEMLRYFEDI